MQRPVRIRRARPRAPAAVWSETAGHQAALLQPPGRGLWFASEIRALGRRLGAAGRSGLLYETLSAGWLNGERTCSSGVLRLPPGRSSISPRDLAATASGAGMTRRRPSSPSAAGSSRRMPRAGPADRLKKTLRRSVRGRLMSDVPLGTMCSGGLDSSLVAALAREEHPRIHAFNAAVVDQPEVDEGPWAEQVADALGIELHTARMTSATWREGLVAAAIHNEHPLVHESSVPMAEIAALASSRGIRVC